MDDTKDIQRTDSLSQFVDAHSLRTNPFGENRAGDRAYRRAERITAALYLLTNHIDRSEPIRERVRNTSARLLEEILDVRDEMRASQSQIVLSVRTKVRHLISLVRILTVAGFVSIQNGSTMIDALDELGNFISLSQRSILAESTVISKDDLLDLSGVNARPVGQKTVRDVKDTISVKDSTVIVNNVDTSISAQVNIGHANSSPRAHNILEILRVSGTLGIRDISANLPEYSEKMIQRELSNLVAAGKVKKTGLKRWSRYSISAA